MARGAGPPATYEHAADRVHYAASTMKLPLLVAAYRRHERGELDLDMLVPVHNELPVGLRRVGVLPRPLRRPGRRDLGRASVRRVSLRTLARHATVKSGNLATDLLLEHVGTAEVAAVLRDAGCSPRPCCRAASRTPRPARPAWTTW